MRSSEQENNIKTHYLYPAALFAEPEPHLVDTILGSCVAVCLYDPVKKIGGINHYMLPFWNGTGLASPKYGNIAIQKLVEKMLFMGSSKGNIQAKIFGGGEVVDTKTNMFKIGERNIEIAENMLAELKIKITGKSIGGKQGRKIRFNTETGVVLMKLIQKST
ncbi:MAG TPA: chemotaxis protein CheD [Marinilabiliales bacterium]|jgi:chemotaxis protein CheD|nr:chemotaxis protein CheD [Salinivirgaceae bacterium]HAM98137.1 chemotaxis protein CheD [Marinilabiliales bacterium]HAZ01003.1 chemotaxis protein CheD [Marinilabiliales bacterium]HBO74695.1 chemotaxis protein CheD [Marinilabiliales bacterium]HBX85707.1 chemotaxis protein CheD [Marinilabiliales bacterium]